MTSFDLISVIAGAITFFSMGYSTGRWQESRKLKAAEDELVANRIKNVLGLVNITELSCDPPIAVPGQIISITFTIKSQANFSYEVWLGTSIVDRSSREYFDIDQDKPLTIEPGLKTYTRYLTLPKNISLDTHSLVGAVWLGQRGMPEHSIRLARLSQDGAIRIQQRGKAHS
jgi:hypothetical protein